MPILTSQVKRLGRQVRSKSDVHFGNALKLEDRAVATVIVRMFSNFQDDELEWIPTEGIFRVFILVTSGKVNFRPEI